MLQLVASAPWQCAHALPARAPSYGSAVSVDQATWSSPLFWSQLHSLIPRLDSAPSLERFRGFVNNLRTEAPGEILRGENGQELLRQYVYPGLQPEDGIERLPFPAPEGWREALETLAPTAQQELQTLLSARPTLDDESVEALDEDALAAQVWNRAAWQGWQFLSLRDAKAFMPRTIRALRESPYPPRTGSWGLRGRQHRVAAASTPTSATISSPHSPG